MAARVGRAAKVARAGFRLEPRGRDRATKGAGTAVGGVGGFAAAVAAVVLRRPVQAPSAWIARACVRPNSSPR